MAFFPRAFYNQDRSFTPLFRLLDDYDTYSRQQNPKSNRQGLTRQWQPKFDVRETADAYELHGELPGVDKDHVKIEFSESQTLLIRGTAKRSCTAGTPPSRQVEDTVMSGGLPDAEEHKNARKATVEDEEDEEWSNASQSRPGTPTTTTATAEVGKKPGAEREKVADKAKYWLTERSVGEFSRSFNFPNRVDQDGVTASFKDGILSIVVPKAKKHESRRIAIN
ncbi:heat shock protein 30 [Metarhizium album ARSEF 1941]|uniref:Heat shock protein 30 n=1 Tax=Metarhizium album (strain ARSEF 1941) TaxID=1081103 RepID=A0A0B2WPG9_METAS|nr:heat shock protein 30 [Metarhizium album ARSEF 1941]KHN95367.1 heat shock protein 30 [Metarhizium album ARSEF 1941]